MGLCICAKGLIQVRATSFIWVYLYAVGLKAGSTLGDSVAITLRFHVPTERQGPLPRCRHKTYITSEATVCVLWFLRQADKNFMVARQLLLHSSVSFSATVRSHLRAAAFH